MGCLEPFRDHRRAQGVFKVGKSGFAGVGGLLRLGFSPGRYRNAAPSWTFRSFPFPEKLALSKGGGGTTGFPIGMRQTSESRPFPTTTRANL